MALIRALHGKKIEGTYVCVCVCSVEEIFGRRGPGKLGRFLRNITIDYYDFRNNRVEKLREF